VNAGYPAVYRNVKCFGKYRVGISLTSGGSDPVHAVILSFLFLQESHNPSVLSDNSNGSTHSFTVSGIREQHISNLSFSLSLFVFYFVFISLVVVVTQT
jgi:hypothetical protein